MEEEQGRPPAAPVPHEAESPFSKGRPEFKQGIKILWEPSVEGLEVLFGFDVPDIDPHRGRLLGARTYQSNRWLDHDLVSQVKIGDADTSLCINKCSKRQG